jgi:hypothetical protein
MAFQLFFQLVLVLAQTCDHQNQKDCQDLCLLALLLLKLLHS